MRRPDDARVARGTDVARVLPFRPRRGTPPFEGPGRRAAPALRQRDESPFRRRRGAIRHARRHPVLRLLRPLAVAAVVVGTPAAVAFWILDSPRFALREIGVDVETHGRVSAGWVRQALRPAVGWNLPRLPLGWVDDALARHPWVASVDVRKKLPDQLVVRVIEKREVALGRGTGPGEPEFWYLDARGQRIAPFDPAAGETDLVLVSGTAPGVGVGPALRLRQEIAAAAPGWAAGLSEIEVLGEEDFRVWSADLPFPLLVRAGTLARKNRHLETLLPEIFHRYDGVAAVDLRFTRRIILQPIAPVRGTASAGVLQKG